MFRPLAQGQVHHIVLPVTQDIYISYSKGKNAGNKLKNMCFRSFLESIEYSIQFKTSLLPNYIKEHLSKFTESCKEFCGNKKMGKSNPDNGEILVHSWKKEVKYIREFVLAIQETPTMFVPIIYISDRVGGPAITPYSSYFLGSSSSDGRGVYVGTSSNIEVPPSLENGGGAVEAKENDPEIIICVVCTVNYKTVLFSPCNHISCCSECSVRMQVCPICKGCIHMQTRVYI